MQKKQQIGAVSLLGAAALVGVVSVAAMAALMSARYERNYFAEAWKRFASSDPMQAVQKTQQTAVAAVKGQSAGIRKCVVNGKPVYSNVECGPGQSMSQVVELHDSRGFEAPKAPPPAVTQKPASMQDKMMEQATR